MIEISSASFLLFRVYPIRIVSDFNIESISIINSQGQCIEQKIFAKKEALGVEPIAIDTTQIDTSVWSINSE